jgi:hypothetical protein
MEVLMTQLKQQAAQIEKVSAQLEMTKPAAKVVVNKPWLLFITTTEL